MVRFNDKPSIQTSDISNDDILPITDLSDSSSDKKITLGQLGDFIQDRGNLAQQDLSNTGMLTDVILKAPNGVFEVGENNDSIIVKSDLNILMPNGKDDDKKLQNIDLTVEEDIEQSVAILSNGEYYVFITDEQTIFFALTTDVFPSYFEPQNPTNNTYWYDINNNLWKNYNETTWATVNISELGFIDVENGEISQINPDQVAFIPNGQLVALRDLSNLSEDGENHFANKDLDNLTEIGLKKLAKEQLTKFSINNGKMTNGVEDILITNSSQREFSFVQPILTENGTIGGSNFAVGGGYANLAYKAFDGDTSSCVQFQLGQCELIMYFPIATKVTQFVNSWVYYAPLSYKISASNDNAAYTDLITITNINWTDVIDLSSNQNYYKYYKITITATGAPNYVADLNNVQITGSYIAGQGGSNVDENNPITYTNGNGETFTKNYLAPIDVSDKADGTYNVMLDSTNQPYLHSGNIYYQKSEPTSITVAGNPTIVDGVAGGFSVSNYLYTQNYNIASGNTWDFYTKFNIANLTSVQTLCGLGEMNSRAMCLNIDTSGYMLLYTSTGGSTWTIFSGVSASTALSINTDYYIHIYFTGTQYKVDISTTGEFNGEEVNYITYASSTSINTNSKYIDLGLYYGTGGNLPFSGTIDLKETKLLVNNQLIWRYGLLPNDIWLNKNTQKAYINQNGELVEFADVPCGKVTIASGIITNVEQPRFNELRYKYSSMPSDKYEDLVLGASGTTYTAKADGYVNVSGQGADILFVWFDNNNQPFPIIHGGQTTNWSGSILCLVTKNQKFRIDYIGTMTIFRFYYTESEV